MNNCHQQEFVNFSSPLYPKMPFRKPVLFLLLINLSRLTVTAQPDQGEIPLLQKLDSIQRSQSVARHFAELYYSTTVKATDFFLNRSKKENDFIERFERRFADFFFRSADAHMQHIPIPREWKAYFTDTALSPLQYKLLGINAHINGDIWKVLTDEFSFGEIKENRDSYFSFQKRLKDQYREFYALSRQSSAKIRLLHATTAGLDKLYGKMMLTRWRKRQLQLALLYYNNRQRFESRLMKLYKKMDHIDRLILRHL